MESKNLEDVYFIFLTTEMGVVKRTLETRCLFFKLSIPDELEMTKYFISILKDMKLRIPESFFIESLLPIVMNSDGSLRKVFSTLEQIILSRDFSANNAYALTTGVSDAKINSFVLNVLEGKLSLAYADFDSIFKGKSPTDVFGVIMKLILNINKYCVLGLDVDNFHGKGIRKMFSGVSPDKVKSLLSKFYEIKKVCGYYIDKYVVEYILFGN
jgi:DNA polymerase III gamma/tau subunit